VLLGATFLGVASLVLALGAQLQYPRAVALLTTGYSVGQILGPLVVTPLLRNGYYVALLVGAVRWRPRSRPRLCASASRDAGPAAMTRRCGRRATRTRR
jgi:hypothetical protein